MSEHTVEVAFVQGDTYQHVTSSRRLREKETLSGNNITPKISAESVQPNNQMVPYRSPAESVQPHNQVIPHRFQQPVVAGQMEAENLPGGQAAARIALLGGRFDFICPEALSGNKCRWGSGCGLMALCFVGIHGRGTN